MDSRPLKGAVLVGSAEAKTGIAKAMAVLRAGGEPIDAVIAGIREVEADPDEHSVGRSGLANWLGQVELVVGLDRDGRPGGVSNLPGHTYLYMTEDMDEYVEARCIHVAVGGS